MVSIFSFHLQVHKGSEKLENFMRDRIGCAFTDLDCLPISLLTEQKYYSGVSGVI